MPSLLILVPLFSLIVLNLPFLKELLKKIAFWLGLGLFGSQVYIMAASLLTTTEHIWNRLNPFLTFNLKVDNLSMALLLCIGLVLAITLMVGRYTIKDKNKRYNFVNLLLVILMGMNGVVMTTDIFSLFVFVEITAVASFILVAFYKTRDGLEAAFKYIILSGTATVLMLSAISLLLIVSGDTSFLAISNALKTSPHNFLIITAIGIFLCGLFIKGGFVPFHAWLPDAHSAAPSPVSVLLSGVQIKVVGAYIIVRLVTSVFGSEEAISAVLMLVGTVSIVFGALAALGQSDFKRMLAFSSVSQVGYIIMGLGTGTSLGIFGAVFHIFNHATFKSLLFVNAAAVEAQTGSRDMDKMSGLSTKMPITGWSSVLASLSAAGIPPLAGFWSKLIIIIALWMSGHHAYAVVAVLASVITLAYLLSMQIRVFFGKPKEELMQIKEAGLGLVLPELILSAIILGVGLFFPLIINHLLLIGKNILGV